MRDAFDNLTHVLTLDQPHEEIHLVARGTVEVADTDDGEPAGRINPKVFLRSTVLTEPDDAIRAFVEPMRAVVRMVRDSSGKGAGNDVGSGAMSGVDRVQRALLAVRHTPVRDTSLAGLVGPPTALHARRGPGGPGLGGARLVG